MKVNSIESMSLIELNHVYKTYGSKRILDNFNYQIDKGSITLLVGPNGSGKTTLLKILMNRTKIDQGEVKTPFKLKERYLPDIIELPYMENTMDFIRWMIQSMNLKLDLKWLYELDIDTTPLCNLSKGNKQKVLLYITLLGKPDIIYLDEPFTALDKKTVKIVVKRIMEMQQAGTSFVISTHEANLFNHLKHEVIAFD